MSRIKNSILRSYKFALGSLLLICLPSLVSSSALSPDRSKPETIEATARGTDTQAAQEFPVTLIIYRYSPRTDRQILIEAFQNGKNQGLADVLSKMKAVGRIAITGTIGGDVTYIEMTPTPTGRRIRFVTNRLLRFGEVYRDGPSLDYNLTAGELDLNDADKTKSTGVLYPAAEFLIDKQGELQMNLIGYPWKLVGIIDWKRATGFE